MFGQVYCPEVNKPAKDGMVLCRRIAGYDHASGQNGKDEWISCLKWRDGCRKCQSDDNQITEAQPQELFE